MESCEDCGFIWETVPHNEIGPRITAGAAAVAGLLRDSAEIATTRPSPERWSMLEYACHIRDVMLMMRDRFVIGLVEDRGDLKPMYRDERVDLGLYRNETPAEVASEIDVAAAMWVRLFAAVDASQLLRVVNYGFPDPTPRTLEWLGQQVVHETEHHLGDIAENKVLIGANG